MKDPAIALIIAQDAWKLVLEDVSYGSKGPPGRLYPVLRERLQTQ